MLAKAKSNKYPRYVGWKTVIYRLIYCTRMEQVKGVKLTTTMTHLRIVCFHFFRCINPKIVFQIRTGKYDIENINNKYQLFEPIFFGIFWRQTNCKSAINSAEIKAIFYGSHPQQVSFIKFSIEQLSIELFPLLCEFKIEPNPDFFSTSFIVSN